MTATEFACDACPTRCRLEVVHDNACPPGRCTRNPTTPVWRGMGAMVLSTEDVNAAVAAATGSPVMSGRRLMACTVCGPTPCLLEAAAESAPLGRAPCPIMMESAVWK